MQIKHRTIQNADHLALYDLLLFVEECVKEGYTVPNINQVDTFPRRFGLGQYYVAMVKEDGEAGVSYDNTVSPKPDKAKQEDKPVQEFSPEVFLEDMESRTTKKALFELMAQYGVSIPEDKQKNVQQIKAYLRTVVKTG